MTTPSAPRPIVDVRQTCRLRGPVVASAIVPGFRSQQPSPSGFECHPGCPTTDDHDLVIDIIGTVDDAFLEERQRLECVRIGNRVLPEPDGDRDQNQGRHDEEGSNDHHCSGIAFIGHPGGVEIRWRTATEDASPSCHSRRKRTHEPSLTPAQSFPNQRHPIRR